MQKISQLTVKNLEILADSRLAHCYLINIAPKFWFCPWCWMIVNVKVIQ